MTHRPLLAWLWPSPPPGPLDDHARQKRWLRLGRRGILRLGGLAFASVLLAAAMGTFVFASAIWADRLDDIIGAAVFSLLALLLARAWSIGTFVNDSGIKIVRVFHTDRFPWSAVSIDFSDGGATVSSAGRKVRTHISRRNIDYLFSDEAYHMACDQLTNWWKSR